MVAEHMSSAARVERSADFADESRGSGPGFFARHSVPLDVVPPCLLLVVAFVAAALVFWYTDIGDTLDNSVMLVESVARGNLPGYYGYAAHHFASTTVYPANYNVLLYAVFGLWNLPTALAHMATGFDYTASFHALLWCKLLVVLAVLGCARFVYRIACEFSGRRHGFVAAFVFLSSACTYVSAFVTVQYDVIPLFVMLMGLWFYLRGRRVAFLVSFAIAVPMKAFALFVFLPLLLLREKNVLKILLAVVLVVLPSKLLGMPFSADPFYRMAVDSQNAAAVDVLMAGTIDLGYLQVNPFFVGYPCACVWSYAVGWGKAGERDDRYFALYLCALVFVMFVALEPVRAYWVVLYVPFLAALIGASGDRAFLVTLVETVAALAGALFMMASNWVFLANNLCDTMLFRNALSSPGLEYRYGSVGNFLAAVDQTRFSPLMWSVFVGGLVLVMFVLRPGAVRRWDSVRGDSLSWSVLLTVRPAILLGMAALVAVVSLETCPVPSYGTEEVQGAVGQTMALDGTAEVAFPIEFERDCILTRMGVQLRREDLGREARTIVSFRLVDRTDGRNVWSGSMPACTIRQDAFNELDIDGAQVWSAHSYELVVSCANPELYRRGAISFFQTTDGSPALFFS